MTTKADVIATLGKCSCGDLRGKSDDDISHTYGEGPICGFKRRPVLESQHREPYRALLGMIAAQRSKNRKFVITQKEKTMSEKTLNLYDLSKDALIICIQGQKAIIDTLKANGGVLPGVQSYRTLYAGDLPEITPAPPCILSLPESQAEKDVNAHYLAAQKRQAQESGNSGTPDPAPSVIGA